MSETQQEQDQQKELQKVPFHYIKNPNYRTIHVDGAHGGLTPHGLLDIAFYAERFPIPTKTVHTVSPEGRIIEEIERVGRDGIVREIEFNIIMSLETAKAIADFIYNQLKLPGK
jgi:hypothetical protein